MPFKPNTSCYRCKSVRVARQQLGFSLIELVIGMLVISIAIVMLTSMFFPQADRSVESLYRMRSAELAHSVMNEVWGKRFDQQTNPNGGVPACNSPLGLPCSTTASLGPDAGEERDDYNDIDDYHGLTINSFMFNSSQTYAAVYKNFNLNVNVSYVDATTQAAKLITVSVTTPSNEVITYQSVRSNY
ncbi:prepilin-type N-terminal cleavage/methylation domain-containing protein [Shewanella subflava]|uniref:Prepilin-type N-terminal cleavage/methylation domain-containing protein n=1 Tax=Shewanella subflava TaxID=2986476 RepID=A0ABT3I4B0_9GAMM|nr:prepilin-type N-terminal cleavage/methylation domain-containing protein [Shewanella subflava]MCW3170896.1 prepilin-type N-terminal cleavage/methylation domain-containing protein [Shewanella subflava]